MGRHVRVIGGLAFLVWLIMRVKAVLLGGDVRSGPLILLRRGGKGAVEE